MKAAFAVPLMFGLMERSAVLIVQIPSMQPALPPWMHLSCNHGYQHKCFIYVLHTQLHPTYMHLHSGMPGQKLFCRHSLTGC